MDIKAELRELYLLRDYIQSGVFQKYLVQPIYKELENLKGSYDCDSLKELYKTKGKKEGLQFFIKQLKIVTEEIQQKEKEIEDLASEKL